MKQLNQKFMELVNECEKMMNDIGFELPKGITYKLNTRMTSTRGRCWRKKDGILIELAKFMMDGAEHENDYFPPKRTILHEMCHAMPNGNSHGEGWKQYVNKINKVYDMGITRTSEVPKSYEMLQERKVPNRIMVDLGCPNGCSTWRKPTTSTFVKNIERYSCPKCNSKIVKL